MRSSGMQILRSKSSERSWLAYSLGRQRAEKRQVARPTLRRHAPFSQEFTPDDVWSAEHRLLYSDLVCVLLLAAAVVADCFADGAVGSRHYRHGAIAERWPLGSGMRAH